MIHHVVDGKLGHKFFSSLHLQPSDVMPPTALTFVDVCSPAPRIWSECVTTFGWDTSDMKQTEA